MKTASDSYKVLGALLGLAVVANACRADRPTATDWTHVREDLKRVGVVVPKAGTIKLYQHDENVRGGDVLLRLRVTDHELESLLDALPLRSKEMQPCAVSAIRVQQGDPAAWKIPPNANSTRCAYGGFTNRGESWGLTLLSVPGDGALDVFVEMDWDIDKPK